MDFFVAPPKIDAREYLSAAEARKTAAVKLTSSPGFWEDEIVQTLLRDHPYIPPQRICVNFKRKDDTQGAAFGYVGITGAPQISIPIIIKNRELYPMDVVIVRNTQDVQQGTDMQQGSGDMTDDKVLPLTEGTFQRALDTGDIGDNIPENQTRGVGYSEDGSNLRLPFRGRTVLASVIGASATQKEQLGKIIGSSKEATAGFLLNNNEDVLSSWLNASEPKRTIQSKIASAPVQLATAWMVKELPQELKTADIFVASVFLEDEQAKTAVCFDAIDLTTPVAGEQRFMLFEDGSYCKAPEKVAGYPVPEAEQDKLARSVTDEATTGSLHRGSIVSFILGDRFSTPAKIASIMTNEEQKSVTLTMQDDLARNYSVLLMPGIKTAMFNEETGVWVLPLMSKVIEVGKYAELKPLATEKVARVIERMVPDQLVCKGGQFTLSVAGETFGVPQCDETKMASFLSGWIDNGEALLEAAKANGQVRFSSDLTEAATKIAAQAEDFYTYPEAVRKEVAGIALKLDLAVKLAASIGDPNGADSILSAGFLNEDNVAEFVNCADQFEETVGKLARLLLAIRMGFPGDESATVVAMKSLQRVADRLQSAVQEVNA